MVIYVANTINYAFATVSDYLLIILNCQFNMIANVMVIYDFTTTSGAGLA
jgi:hypothetical protein